MSALGQSVEADQVRSPVYVRFTPKADMAHRSLRQLLANAAIAASRVSTPVFIAPLMV